MSIKKIFLDKVIGLLFFAFNFNANADNVEISGIPFSGSHITFHIAWGNSCNASVAPNNSDADRELKSIG
ncbi:MAG: hypothetical protein IE931_08260 [Sphingobacteriales bacterium]|nr:hypothetical protein [Sphingobacteriales bacterium]